VTDSAGFRENNYSSVHEKHASWAQPHVVKEEFYRTFVLIAGKIPYWAVLPVGLMDRDYESWIKAAARGVGNALDPDDYIDLGNLTAVDTRECYSAMFHLLSRAYDDPVNALIKGSLLAWQSLSQDNRGPLCDVAKKRFAESRFDSELVNPSVLVYDTVLKFYEGLNDQDGLALIRDCIYLQIVGYPVPRPVKTDTSEYRLLKRYLNGWTWTAGRARQLQDYAIWPENEKLAFEDRLIKKLSSLCAQSLCVYNRKRRNIENDIALLTALDNATFNDIKGGENRPAYASAYLRDIDIDHCLGVSFEAGSDGAGRWVVRDNRARAVQGKDFLLFTAPRLLYVLGWIVFNRLHRGKNTSIEFFHRTGSPVPSGRARQVFEEVCAFFSDDSTSRSALRVRPECVRVFVALESGVVASNRRTEWADFLVQKEQMGMCFTTLDLSRIQSALLKHHCVATHIWNHLKNVAPEHGAYHVVDFRTVQDPTVSGAIDDFIAEFRKGDSEISLSEAGRKSADPPSGRSHGSGFLLDLL